MQYKYIAQAYGETYYGQCEYGAENTQCLQEAGGSSGAGANNGGLADTGIWLMVALSVAVFVIFAALAVRLLWRKKPQTPPETPAQ